MILWGLTGDIENYRLITAALQAGTTSLRKVFQDPGCTGTGILLNLNMSKKQRYCLIPKILKITLRLLII